MFYRNVGLSFNGLHGIISQRIEHHSESVTFNFKFVSLLEVQIIFYELFLKVSWCRTLVHDLKY
jgi:hypothetical protein